MKTSATSPPDGPISAEAIRYDQQIEQGQYQEPHNTFLKHSTSLLSL